jgi:hypothetical protein
LEFLHHHTLSNMLFDMIFETHCVQILSCFNLSAGVWHTTQLTFPKFWLPSPSSSKCFEHNLDYHIPLLQIMTFKTINFDQKVPLSNINKKNHFNHFGQVVCGMTNLIGGLFD